MTSYAAEPSPQVRARVAGVLYLVLGVFAGFSLQYVASRLIVSGNAAATAANILASESLFRLGIVSNLVVALINIFLALALYQLLKPVNANMAALMVILILVATPIVMLNELNHVALLLLAHGPAGLTADQAHALMSFFLHLHAYGYGVAEIFYGLWLFPMGYLVFTSGFLPRFLGVLLIIGCFGYLAQSVVDLLFPSSGVIIYLYTSWGELVFPLWLVIRGVNVERWEKRVHAVV
jgi:hypothetical protein